MLSDRIVATCDGVELTLAGRHRSQRRASRVLLVHCWATFRAAAVATIAAAPAEDSRVDAASTAAATDPAATIPAATIAAAAVTKPTAAIARSAARPLCRPDAASSRADAHII